MIPELSLDEDGPDLSAVVFSRCLIGSLYLNGDPKPERLPGFIENVRVVTLDRGPHNIAWTHPDEVNVALLTFLAE